MNRLFAKEDEELSAWSEAHFERLKKNAPKPPSDASAGQTAEGNPDISWPLERPNPDGTFRPRVDATLRPQGDKLSESLMSDQAANVAGITVSMTDMLPGKKRAQSGIALRAWCLGQVLSLSVFFAVYARYTDSRLWRPPFFMACLALFHFLEFWTHAMFNLPNATISAFLLFDNGWPYMLAHTAAMVETIVTSVFFPEWQDKVSPQSIGTLQLPIVQATGFALVFVGQLVRSMAIAKAGTNFNHKVQHKKSDTHVLVTDGIYGVLRHPSYFGFFWWAVGTQIALGNVICVFIYAIVLWRFFNRRIHNEERHLMVFFGKHYSMYRAYTFIGIPFITSQEYPELNKQSMDGQGSEDKKTE